MTSNELKRRLARSVRYRSQAVADAAWWRTPAGRRNQAALESLRGRYSGRRCFVIGNGPSLRSTDVSLLAKEVTIGSNALFLLFGEMGYEPTFLTVEDRLVAEDRADELNAVRGATKIFPRDLSYCLTADENTLYVNFLRDYEGSPRFSDAFNEVAYWGGTVSFFNLQLAYHLGCSPIYLIGFDHSYTVPKAGYDAGIITSQSPDENHFHPDYFGEGYRWHDPEVGRMEEAYREARRFLEGRGVAVMNATAGGALEVFPRAAYDELLER